jgi:pyruvate/2-oxoglutarate dehydrogenase complex dihydrolipoamide acyltransferase (E2) component
MPIVSIRIPQLGEGLQEALLVELLKKPGDLVTRDEPIYVMETDKATTDVESPYGGRLIEWTAQPGSVLPIGSEIARMEAIDYTEIETTPHVHSSEVRGSPPNLESPQEKNEETSSDLNLNMPDASARSGTPPLIPPRTRKYLKDLALLEHSDKIPIKGSRMMPEDVDAYLAQQSSRNVPSAGPQSTTDLSSDYQTIPLPRTQISLNYRMAKGMGACIPVTVVNDLDWTAIELVRNQFSSDHAPTGFCLVCWAVVQVMTRHPKFRSSLLPSGNAIKVCQDVNIGIAVALPNDEMVTAVVAQANRMKLEEFCSAYRQQIQLAQTGRDQANESTSLTVSNIGKAGMRIGIPAIVAPAVATLAIGRVTPQAVPDGEGIRFIPMASATLSFDHRIVNGVGAANFMSDLEMEVKQMHYPTR